MEVYPQQPWTFNGGQRPSDSVASHCSLAVRNTSCCQSRSHIDVGCNVASITSDLASRSAISLKKIGKMSVSCSPFLNNNCVSYSNLCFTTHLVFLKQSLQSFLTLVRTNIITSIGLNVIMVYTIRTFLTRSWLVYSPTLTRITTTQGLLSNVLPFLPPLSRPLISTACS